MADDIKRVVVRLSAEGGASAGQQVEQFTRKATEGLQATGRAARAARNELAQAQVQLTDIVVSLASGQSPVTVLLQQGGQLRDVFGSVGGAVGAVSRAVASMVTPVTAVAAASAALAAAFITSERNTQAFRDAMIQSGGAAGVTRTKFEEMIASIAKEAQVGAGSVRDITEALVKSGKVGPAALESTALAVQLVAEVTGRTAEDVASDFSGMSRDVAKWAAEHNRSWNYIDADQYRYIRRLQESGREEQAAIESNKAVIEQFSKQRESLTETEKLWNKVKTAASEAWHAMIFGAGEETNGQKIADLQKQLEIRLARGPLPMVSQESFEKGNQALRTQIDALKEIEKLAERSATNKAVAARADQKAIEAAEEAARKSKADAEKAARDAIEAAKKELEYRQMVADTLAYRVPRPIDIDNGNGGNTVLALAAAEKQSQAIADATYKANSQRERQAQDFARELLDEAEQLNVDLIESDTERAQAQLDIEVRRMRERMELLRVDGDERIKMEESIARIIAARKQAIEIQAARAARTELDKTLEGAAKDIWTKLSTGETIKGSDILKQITGAMAQDSWKNSIRPLLTGDKPGAEGGDFLSKMLDKLGGSADKTATGFDSIIAKMSGFENGLGGIAQALWQMVAGSGGASGGGLGGLFGSLAGLFGESSSTVAQPLTDMGSSTVGMSLAKGGAFTNKVFHHTTPFAFRRGDSFSMGIMGEAGDEAVMPLARDGAGRLGVRAQGGGGARQVSYVTHLTQVFAPGVTQADMAMHGQALANQMRAETINSAVRPGGALWRAARGY